MSNRLEPRRSKFIKVEDQVTKIKMDDYVDAIQKDDIVVKDEDFQKEITGDVRREGSKVDDIEDRIAAKVENSHMKITQDILQENVEDGAYEKTCVDIRESVTQERERVLEVVPSPSNSSSFVNLKNTLSGTGGNLGNEMKGSDQIATAQNQQGNNLITKRYRCDLCQYQTNIKGLMKKHLLIHLGTKLFKCPECHYECNDRSNLKRHLSTHSHSKFKCSECGFECNGKESLKRHKFNHVNSKLYKCPACDYECNFKNTFNRHLLIHSDPKFKCSECDYKCRDKSSFQRHSLNHSDLNLFKCSECDYEGNHKGNFNKHKLVHSETKQFKCFECSYECRRKGQLVKHLTYHSEQQLDSLAR